MSDKLEEIEQEGKTVGCNEYMTVPVKKAKRTCRCRVVQGTGEFTWASKASENEIVAQHSLRRKTTSVTNGGHHAKTKSHTQSVRAVVAATISAYFVKTVSATGVEWQVCSRITISRLHKLTRSTGVKNDASACPPGLQIPFRSRMILTFHLLTPNLIHSDICPWTTSANLHQNRFIRFQNFVFTGLVIEERTNVQFWAKKCAECTGTVCVYYWCNWTINIVLLTYLVCLARF